MTPYATRPTRWRPAPYAARSAQAQYGPINIHAPIIPRPASNLPFDQQKSIQQLPFANPQDPPFVFAQKSIQRLEYAAGNSYAPQTNRNYDAAIKRYLLFTSRCGVPPSVALPSPPYLVALWIASGLGDTGPGTAKNNLAALGSWHKTRGIPFETPIQMATIQRSIKLHWPGSKRKPPRPPITPAMIRLLAQEWQDGSTRQLCALAIALTAWGGQLRLGEIVPPSSRQLDRQRLPTRDHWSASPLSPKASRIKLPWTKTTGSDGATVHLIEQVYPFDPSQALYRHLRGSPLAPSSLICEYRAGSSSKILDKVTLMDMCNKVWSKQGIARITGHSFRIGGTTALLRNGVDPEVVKQMGRWSSNAFHLYWRNLEEIFTTHASRIDWVDFVF